MPMVEMETDYLGPPPEDLLPSYQQLQGGPPLKSISLLEVTSFLWQPTTDDSQTHIKRTISAPHGLAMCVLQRTGYIIFRAQCKMKMWTTMFKIYYKVQEDGRIMNKPGTLLSVEPIAPIQVACL